MKVNNKIETNLLNVLLQQEEAILYDWLYFCPPIYTANIPTMGVDKHKQLYINPKFLGSLSTDEIIGCLYHEALHLIYEHHLSKGKPYLVNTAGDIYINELLVKEGFKIPESAEFRYKYNIPDNIITCQEIYDWLEKNLSEDIKIILKQEYDNEQNTYNDIETNKTETNKTETNKEVNEEIVNTIFTKLAGKITEKFNKIKPADINITWDLDLQIHIGRLIKRDVFKNYLRPPRVEIPNLIRPAYTKNVRIPKIHVYIDTSGSMEHTLPIVIKTLQETKKKLKEYIPKYFGFNTEIYEIKESDIETNNISCNGGTEFKKVIDGADLHIIITDGELDFKYIDSCKNVIVYLCNGETIIRK